MTVDYRKFIVSEMIALIQRKYKFETIPFIFENKLEYIIIKPRFNFQLYSQSEISIYKTIFVIDFFYFKISRNLY